jgi:hypothetical protein
MSPGALASFWGLCLVQGVIVLLPGSAHSRRLDALRARWLLIAVPAAALIGATFIPRIAALLAADVSLLALASVPPLAAVGAAWAIRWHGIRLVPLVPLLLVVAWNAPESPPGEAAALLLVALSCVALAVLVVAVLPPAVAKIGIVVWAAADLSFALAHDLVRASSAISHAAPAVAPDLLRLQLQRVVIGQSSMEYADLFIAATLGAILVAESRERGPAALLVAVLAMSLAPLFLVTDVVPGTVPVALALFVEELRLRSRLSGSWIHRSADAARGARRASSAA